MPRTGVYNILTRVVRLLPITSVKLKSFLRCVTETKIYDQDAFSVMSGKIDKQVLDLGS